MTIERMDHVSIVVEDLAQAIEFFEELGLGLKNEGSVEGTEVDRIIGLDGARSDIAFLQTPDGHGQIELVKFNSPPLKEGNPEAPVNTPGLSHLCFAIDDVEAAVARLQAKGGELVGEVVSYGNSYKLCYIRGPEGVIVELAEKIGPSDREEK
ncbi:MAG TPA: VOC family protein [Solirubrobacterales bacterium]|jgi:catechol 2,3-dioxygenase-like lactoylglutathione lyase family enzyme|nr:VOC family protein [Solirubrobacterales bacterium]